MSDLWSDPNLPSDLASETNRQRQKTYGNPTPNMEVFAAYLAVLFGHEVSAEQASVVCILLKVMREQQSGFDPDYNDNLVDVCGWANVLYQVKQSKEAERRGPSETPGGSTGVEGSQLP